MYGPLDTFTLKRITTLLGEKETTLKAKIDEVVKELIETQYNEEDIYEYIRGLVVKSIEES